MSADRSPAALKIDRSWRRLVGPDPQTYLVALAFFSVTFAIIPFTIYADFGDDWGFPYYQLLYVSGLGVVLYPTLLEFLRLEPDAPTLGKSVYAIRPGERREARFAFDPDRKHGPDLVEIRIEDQTDLPRSRLTVLGPATDPASWQIE